MAKVCLGLIKDEYLTTESVHQSFTEPDVWTKARILKNEMKTLVELFPPEKKFRLCDQLIRSSRGINSMIAEGHSRFTFKDQLHFCIIARGGLRETLNHLIGAFDCKYTSEDKLISFKKMTDETGKLLNGYISYLRNNIKKQWL